MPLSTKTLALIGLALTNLFWATNTVLARFLSEDIAPFTTTLIRWLLALLLLLPFTAKALGSHGQELRRRWPVIAILGLLGITIYNSILYLAAHSTTAINITLVNAALPLVTLIISWLFLAEKPSRHQLLGIALSLIGVGFIVSEGAVDQLIQVNIKQGDLLVLGIVCCWSLYSVILRKYPINIAPAPLLTALIAAGLPLLVILTLVEQHSLATSHWIQTKDLPVYFYMALFPSILAYLFWAYGIEVVGPNIASLSCYLVPLLTAMMAIPLLGEQLHWYHLCGGLLILAGLYFGSLFQQKTAKKHK